MIVEVAIGTLLLSDNAQIIPAEASMIRIESRILMLEAFRFDSGNFFCDKYIPTIPIGTLIQNIHCHISLATIKPPNAGPTISASPPIPLQIPQARPRSSDGKADVKIAIDIGVMTEAPIPSIIRATIRKLMLFDSAHKIEPITNTRIPRL